jgi:serine/threonine-protein kinase
VTDTVIAALRDRYTFERELGRGGFAVVWLARDVRHDRLVALKVIHEEVAQSVGRERFEREIKLVARLQHPHILGVFDSGEVNGRLWFTMPFVQGESLRTRLARERQLPVADAARIAGEVADALDYAHRQGVIHRDIKPENILLTERHALVADFGIARAVAGGAQQSSLTMTGTGIGTPGYMSPEQALGGTDVDARTDIYALGCVLYEMLAGEPPFTGPTPQAVIARVMSEDPRPLATIRPGLPAQLEPVIRKAMSRITADRYATAADFTRALEQATQAAVPTMEAPVGTLGAIASVRPRRVPHIPVALVAGVVVVLGIAGWIIVKRGGASDKTPALAVLPFESFGTADDATFADGMTEEVRGKLAGVPGLRVIARTSSNQYRASRKTPREIGQELGVRYLLTGTVRWSNGAEGQRRVRVTPELINAADGSTRWQAPFDEDLKDMFTMQTAIATNVANALDVALGAAAREQLAARPTDDLPAYREYLLGEAATEGMVKNDRLSFKNGLDHYERAIALDSNYGDPWARIAHIHIVNASTTYSRDEFERGRDALAHAVRLTPRGVPASMARSRAASVFDKNFALAAAILDTLVRQVPSNAEALASLAAAEAVLARWDQAVAHARRAAELDPRNPLAMSRLARVLHGTRQYPAADSVLARLLQFSPGNIAVSQSRVINLTSMGDTATSARVIRETLQKADTNELIAYYALYQEMMWVLPLDLQRRITTLTPAAFFNNRQQWALKVGRQWAMLGDTTKAHAYGDSAVAIARPQLAENPNDAQIYELLARSLALAGKRAEAVEYAEKALKMRETEQDATTGNYVRYQAVRVLIQAGANDRALELMGPLMTGYYSELTPAWLRLDPVFKPLKGNPRFEAMAAGR